MRRRDWSRRDSSRLLRRRDWLGRPPWAVMKRRMMTLLLWTMLPRLMTTQPRMQMKPVMMHQRQMMVLVMELETMVHLLMM